MTNHILATVNFEPNLLTKAQGSWVWDIDYNKYLDFVSGCWSVNLGHNHPKIVETIKEQASKLIHRSMWYLTDETVEAAKQLVKFVPHNHDKATFLSSGSEAVEFALNFAIKVSKKIKILSLKDGFYGSFGLGKEASYFSHKVSRLRIDYPRCNDLNCDCLDKYNSLIDLILRNYAKDLACFAIEPIMASGGILKPCSSFIDELCKRLQEEQILVVANEVTSGFGRTGKLFAQEHFSFRPDIVVLGKAMGNGYPVSAIVTDSILEEKLSSVELYYAQSHQLDPLGTAVAKTVMNVFKTEEIIKNVQDKISILDNFLSTLDYPFIKEVRIHGMLLAIVFQSYKKSSAQELILDVKNKLRREGIIVGYSLGKELIRLLPPLTINTNEIAFFKDTLLHILDQI